MEIKNTEYYLQHTEFFRTPPVAEHTVFCSDGFSYVGNELALAVYRSAKSNYFITSIHDGKVLKALRGSIPDAVALCESYIRLLDSVL